ALEHGDDGGVVPAPAPPALAVPGAGPGWYRGDLHLHSVHSDGGRDLDELAAAARVAKLDFIVSTEHNTNSANRVWGAHEPDGLLPADRGGAGRPGHVGDRGGGARGSRVSRRVVGGRGRPDRVGRRAGRVRGWAGRVRGWAGRYRRGPTGRVTVRATVTGAPS